MDSVHSMTLPFTTYDSANGAHRFQSSVAQIMLAVIGSGPPALTYWDIGPRLSDMPEVAENVTLIYPIVAYV